MAIQFAERMQNLRASDIRELLKLTQKAGIISFAGGLPAPEFFPVHEMAALAVELMEKEGREALQYSTTEGCTKLRRIIAARMNKVYNTRVDVDNILITSGSQQGLDFSGKIFFDPGDVVLCESPTYLGAINAFRAYQPRFVEVETDAEGMVIAKLEQALAREPRAKFIYVIPDFQNPTGRTWSHERRLAFMDLVNRHQIPVVEDNPYGELRFEGTSQPSLKSLDTKGLVIFLGTFSKIFCPGLRIGWLAADQPIYEKYVLVKQGADLQTATLSQKQVLAYMEHYDIDENIARIRDNYRKRRDAMVEAIELEFPPEVMITRPEGGLFLWATLPAEINTRDLLVACLQENVAFVPGGSFFPNGGNENTMRLNYSNMPEDKIREGIKRMGVAIRAFMARTADLREEVAATER